MSFRGLPTDNFKSNRVLFAALASCAVMGGAIIVWATPWGVGLSPDSAIYIGGARSLSEMTGYSQPVDASTYSPIVHYPPLYSASLAILGGLGLDLFQAARWLNTVLFGANAMLAGYVVFKATRRRGWAVAAAALMATAFPLTQVHTMAWSEPLFIFLELCVWLFLLDYSRSLSPRNRSWQESRPGWLF